MLACSLVPPLCDDGEGRDGTDSDVGEEGWSRRSVLGTAAAAAEKLIN